MSLEVISGHQYLVDPIEGVGGGHKVRVFLKCTP